MIENDNQLKVTAEQLRKLVQALKLLDEADNSEIHPLLLKAQRTGLNSMCDELAGEILDYVIKMTSKG